MADDELPDTGEPLRNPKWEKFCILVVAGQPVQDAYEMAGFNPHRANCFRLRKHPDIERRITHLCSLRAARVIEAPPQLPAPAVELTPEAIERIEATKDYVVSSLIYNAEIALGRRLTKSTIRVPRKKPTKAGPVEKDQAPTITFEHTDRNGSVANAALGMLGKHIGMWNEKTPAGELDPAKQGAIKLTEKEKALALLARYYPQHQSGDGPDSPKAS